MTLDHQTTAYAAAAQVMAGGSSRQLASIEFEDEDVQAVCIEVNRDGSCSVTLINADGIPVGGYSL